MFSDIVDADSHEREPTSRHVVGTEIQRDCNFEAHVYHFSYRLGYMPSHWFIFFAQLQYNLLVHPYRYTILAVNLNRRLHKDFPRSQASSGSNTRSCSTTAEPSKCNEHGTIQKGSAQCIVGAVGFSCLLYTTIYSANCDI